MLDLKQASNFLVSVKKEKVLEVAAEKVVKAALPRRSLGFSRSPWTNLRWGMLFPSSFSWSSSWAWAWAVRWGLVLAIVFFLGFVFFTGLGLVLRFHAHITTSATSNTNYHLPPEHKGGWFRAGLWLWVFRSRRLQLVMVRFVWFWLLK